MTELVIFDVEHGACALLDCGNGSRLLIDCGHSSTTGWTPGQHLQGLGVRTLTKLVITNYDEDHVSGLIDLKQRVDVDWLQRNKSVTGATMRHLKSDTGMGRNIEFLSTMVDNYTPSTDPRPEFPGVTQEVYWNSYPEFDDENNLSLVLVLRVHGTVFIFPGDMECKGWEHLLAREPQLQRAVAECHVLVASHHGRDSGICDDMFTKYGCNPQVVVISDDYHQYDTQKTVPYYRSKARGISFRGGQRYVLTTRDDGDIRFRWSALSGCICF